MGTVWDTKNLPYWNPILLGINMGLDFCKVSTSIWEYLVPSVPQTMPGIHQVEQDTPQVIPDEGEGPPGDIEAEFLQWHHRLGKFLQMGSS
jgi:hypothetical protein